MSRPDRQRGFVLTEVLVVMLVGTILLGSTLLTFANFVSNENENDKRNDSIEMARNALDVEARQLRNLAKRITFNVIDTVEADQFIFQTSDPTRTRVRYCVDAADPASARVFEQTQALGVSGAGVPVTTAMRTNCPSASSSWTRTRMVADNVVNRAGGLNRGMFDYRCAGGGTTCTASAATFDRIVGVGATLYVDTSPTTDPPEERVSSAVYLRNQNQAPVAEFTATAVAGKSRTVLLNASGSTDYEQRTLTYFWFAGTMPTAANVDCTKQPGSQAAGQPSPWGVEPIGTGVTLEHKWEGTTPASGTAQTVGVVACDPGDRSSAVVTQTVTIPS